MEAHLIKITFQKADKSGNGRISRDELAAVFRDLGDWSEGELTEMFNAIDADKSGYIKYQEFVDWVMEDTHIADEDLDVDARDALFADGEDVEDDEDDQDTGAGDEMENRGDEDHIPDAHLDTQQLLSETEYVMLIRRLDEDEDEARAVYRRVQRDLLDDGEDVSSGIPLHEFLEDLEVQLTDRESCELIKGILDEVFAMESRGEDDPPPLDRKALRPAVSAIVRELDQARRPAEDAMAMVEEGKVMLTEVGRAAIDDLNAQGGLVEMVQECQIHPPLLPTTAGQNANREHCIRKVEAIIEECRANGTKFTDPDWNMYSDDKSVLYVDREAPGWDCTVGVPHGYKRLTELIAGAPQKRKMSLFSMLPSASGGPILFKGGVRPGDIVQGQIGTCFLLGAMGALASSSEKAIRNAFIKYDIEVGVYGVRFNLDGEWTHVIVDDVMPVDKYGELLYAKSKDHSEVWVALLEKAFCKLHTCYEMCDGGRAGEALFSFLGGFSGRFAISDKHRQNPSLYFKILETAIEKGWILTTSFVPRKKKKGKTGKCGEAMLAGGLVGGHVYSVLKVVQADGNQLVCCRNPWGQGEWTGKWSDKNQLGEWTEEMREACDFRGQNDGKFWMSVADFVENSAGADYSRKFGPKWKKVTQFKHFQKGPLTAVSMWPYNARSNDEVGFPRHAELEVDCVTSGWWYGNVLGDSKKGYFPGNYVKLQDRPVARFDLTTEGATKAVAILMQPNVMMQRHWHIRKGTALNYKDTTYGAMQLVIIGPDNSVVMSRTAHKRSIGWEFDVSCGGIWKIYCMDYDGRGEKFVLRAYVQGGTAALQEEEADFNELRAATGE